MHHSPTVSARAQPFLFLSLLLALASHSHEALGQLSTVAEASNYRRTSTHADVERFVEALAKQSDHARQVSFGASVEGRSLTGLILADPMIGSPADLPTDGRLVIFLLGNIHSGECAGKEAILSLCRDLSIGDSHSLLKHFIIVALPNLNTDGNEQQGPHHRPGQVGPTEGTGLRENAQGLDLNRDFVKLETPEVRALVKAIRVWNPHLFIDTHTTNGSRHRYALTYEIANNPASPLAPREWLRKTLLPEVTEKLAQGNLNTFFYGNFNKEHTRWTTFGHEPRYSSEYMGLRGRLAILSEAYSYIPYRDRIAVHQAFILETLRVLASEAPAVTTLLDRTLSEIPTTQSIRAQNSPHPKSVTILGYESDTEDNPQNQSQPRDYVVEHYARFQSTLETKRPYAYLLDADYGRTAQRLLWHGVQLHQLTEAHNLTVQRYRLTKITKAASPLQGHRTTSVEITPEQSTEHIPAGTYLVYTKQPLAELLTYFLEPRSDDNFTTWNFFDRSLKTGHPHPLRIIPVARALKARAIEKIEPASRLTLDQIYGPRGRVPFGGTFPLSLRWLPKTAQYRLRIGSRDYHVDAETGGRTPAPKTDNTAAQKKLESLKGLSAEDAAKLSRQGQLTPTKDATLYRHQKDLFIYEHKSQQLRRLTTDKQTKQLITFSSDGKHIAFVRNYNLVIVPTAGGTEIKVTSDGKENLLNGYLDWVYQEELYGRGNFRGFWWSPASQAIAFLRLDERPVAKYTISDHLAYREKSEATYYPKAGDPLPKVGLAIYRLGDKEATHINLEGYGDELLISHVHWAPDGQNLYFQAQNREQTWLDLCTVRTGETVPTRLFRERTRAWVSSPGAPHFLADGSFLWLSESSGYRHIYHIIRNAKRRRALTQGPWEVQKLLGIDQHNGWLYFVANKDSGTEAHAYRIALGGGRISRLTKQAGNHAVRFNDDFSHYIDYVSGIHQPISVSLHRADGTHIRTLAPNLVDYLPYYQLQEPEFVRYKARDGHTLSGILIKPSDFDPQKRYPVLCHVYGGPQAPVVRNRWGGSTYLWHQYLAQQGYVIWLSDNRASTHEGARGAWSMHLEMGKTELHDLEDGINWLSRKPWIDRKRVGIWGWSYGGYLVTYALTHSKLFKAGIAGAPVTDWRNYDAIYTERYMGLPKDNPEGYKKASPVHAAAQLEGKLLLIHGALDDNVHLSNTLQFSHALQKSGKQFEMMIYPNNRHGITRPGQSRHLRDLMTEFILRNL